MGDKFKILIATHGFSQSVFKVGSFHLSRKWAEEGHQVLTLTTPVSLLHPLLSKNKEEVKLKFSNTKGLNIRDVNLYEFVPLAILPQQTIPGFFYRFNLLNKYQIKDFKTVDYLFIENPFFYGLTNVIKYKKLIYRVTDIYLEFSDFKNTLKSLEQKLLDKADVVICTSVGIRSYLRQVYKLNKEIHVVENGVNVDDFNNHAASVLPPDYEKYLKLYKTNAVYVGALDERFDFEFLHQLALETPNIGYHIYGPANPSLSLRQTKNVHFHGAVEYKQLPKLLEKFDFGILPFAPIALNEGRSPMKLFENGLAGLPTLAKRTQDLTQKEQQYNFIFLYVSLNEATKQIHLILQNLPTLKILAKTESRFEAWETKAKSILQIVNN